MKKISRILFATVMLTLLFVCNFKAIKAAEVAESAIKQNDYSIIDCSDTKDGYLRIKYIKATKKKLKAQVTGPKGVVYTYNITPGRYEVFPLSEGDGTYKASIFQNISGTTYSLVLAHTFTVNLKDEFGPFLLPNQYVNYTEKSAVVKKAEELTKGVKDPIKKVKKVYDYVIKNFRYDTKKATTVQSGYLPNVDAILKKKVGICFDYASVMTAMLRSRGVPTKLVVGYCGDAYHAWINVYTEKDGWVDEVIFFDGETWKLMDPTFASSAKSSKNAKKYIGDGKKYKSKYLY